MIHILICFLLAPNNIIFECCILLLIHVSIICPHDTPSISVEFSIHRPYPSPISRYENATQIRSLLPEQLVRGVQWEGSMRHLLDAATTMGGNAVRPRGFYETGPGKQLKAMLRKLDQEAFQACTVIDVMPPKT